jgi:UDP-GlcNAc:undecaprenyl-phosphate GlcNAc-1-phosphate transferase
MIHASLLLLAALAALLLTPLVARLAHHFGVVDVPGPRKAHAGSVPRLGGLAVVLGAACGLLAWSWFFSAALPASLRALLAGGSLVFAVGVLDDVRRTPAWIKLLCELLAAHVVTSYGVAIFSVTLAGVRLPLGPLWYPITILWIVGLTNAFNLIDGLDGLAAGIALISGSTCALILLVRGNGDEALVLIALVGAAAGFLPWNLSPARVFLGDCGSLAFGFTLAVTAITGLQKGATALSVGAPLLLFALPIVETLLSVIRRSLRGTRREGWKGVLEVLVADQEHMHHRLVAAGMTPRSVVLLFYTLTLGLSLVALATVRGAR